MSAARSNVLGAFLGAVLVPLAWGVGIDASVYKLHLPDAAEGRGIEGEGFRLAPPYRAPEIRTENDKLRDLPYAAEVASVSREYALDPALVHALIHVESRHNAKALSPRGAVGLMQVLPETSAHLGFAPGDHSVMSNLQAGSRYLSALIQQFGGHLDLALAGYNAGPGAVVKYGNQVPPYRETQDYVPSVMAKFSTSIAFWAKTALACRSDHTNNLPRIGCWRRYVPSLSSKLARRYTKILRRNLQNVVTTGTPGEAHFIM